MSHQLQKFPNGTASIRNTQLQENMHSQIGAWEEAQLIYIQQSHLEQALRSQQKAPLVIFDVGLGIAANALAVLSLFEKTQVSRSVHLISFEKDLAGLELALKNSESFPFLQGREPLFHSLLKEQTLSFDSPSRVRFQWDLIVGDFRDFILKVPPPEIIYYDLYSPQANPELWGFYTFSLIHESTLSRREKNETTSLFTYCSSTAARAALLLAGFYVGTGVPTPQKKETTVASTQKQTLLSPLNQKWLEHWKRSSKPLPDDYPTHLPCDLHKKITKS